MPTIKIRMSEEKAPEGLLEALFKSLEEDMKQDKEENCEECLKAIKRLRVLECATPTQFGQIWDRTLKGEKFTALVDELGRVQDELDALARAKERAA